MPIERDLAACDRDVRDCERPNAKPEGGRLDFGKAMIALHPCVSWGRRAHPSPCSTNRVQVSDRPSLGYALIVINRVVSHFTSNPGKLNVTIMDTGRAGAGNRYRSGSIEIDALSRRVLIDGTPGKIGARAFDVLLGLVERRERVVSKQELMDLVWPKLVVEENNLLVHMVALRKLLGPRAITTIPGRGYRFALPIDTVSRGLGESAQSAAIRGNLPASPPLFGREKDLEAVDLLLREHMVVSIVGAAGIGKTRLGLASAASARLELPDGCWWVELAPINEGVQVPNSVSAVLGTNLATGRSPQEALAMVLASRNLLLVLDNCEHLAEDIASLIELLRARAPNVRFLVTAQESLKCRDEHVYRLGALAIPANAQLEDAARFGAVALFVERAHSADSRFRLAADNVQAVVDVCRRLDGIPLAIELAAARVPLLGAHGLHSRLDQIFNVLSGGARMKLRRHQTLRAALDWSHELLSADEQAVFRRLGVFAGGFTMELAQEVISDQQTDRWAVLDLLGHLVDKSLVIADGENEPRYRLLETTRAFALEQLAAAGESEALLRRHAEAMRALMSAIDANRWTLSLPERESAVHELGNLRAALDWSLASPDHRSLAYELLSKSWLVWMLNGLAYEGLQRMLQISPLPANLMPRIEADFFLALAQLDQRGGHDEAWNAALRAQAGGRTLAVRLGARAGRRGGVRRGRTRPGERRRRLVREPVPHPGRVAARERALAAARGRDAPSLPGRDAR